MLQSQLQEHNRTLKFRVVLDEGRYRVEMKFDTDWQRTSMIEDTYHDAIGQIISVVTRKPYIKYYNSQVHRHNKEYISSIV